ncbi:hypothetical protein R1sor_023473 [Riccia sorocarpa]|uniref:Peptidase C14 caspase domain-containing protein n=1 Tax=Riccia sorocarpa TaxID=122646 RepID=A0ABD3GPV7_9MARC
MTKRAILIGCNYPGTKVGLNGCVNDVKRMYNILVNKYGFEEENIKLMTDVDDENDPPTGANIKRAIKQVVSDSEEGDVFYLHFSGHGTQVPAESGDHEDDGMDEAIVPTDLNLITDDDFRILLKPLAGGVQFTFVSDSCHSGGLLDGEQVQIGIADDGELGDETEEHAEEGSTRDFTPAAEKYVDVGTLQELLSERTGQEVSLGTIRTVLFDVFGDDASPTVKVFVKHIKERLEDGVSEEEILELYGETGHMAVAYLKAKMDDEEIDNDEYFGKVDVDGPVNRSGHANAKPDPEDCLPPGTGILISGCQSNQTSADANPTGDPADAYGALTHTIIGVVEELDGNITNGELVNAVRKKLAESKFTQRPCLFSVEEAVDIPFICEPVC